MTHRCLDLFAVFCPTLIWGTLSGPSMVPQIACGPPKGFETLLLRSTFGRPGSDLLPKALPKRSWLQVRQICSSTSIDLGIIFDIFGHGFYMGAIIIFAIFLIQFHTYDICWFLRVPSVSADFLCFQSLATQNTTRKYWLGQRPKAAFVCSGGHVRAAEGRHRSCSTQAGRSMVSLACIFLFIVASAP